MPYTLYEIVNDMTKTEKFNFLKEAYIHYTKGRILRITFNEILYMVFGG